MKRNHIAILLLFFVSTSLLIGQTNQPIKLGENVVFPSPQATNFNKYGGLKLNYSSGLPNVNIPIYEVNEGSLTIPISLSYHYSGFKPTNEPSWVGVGWSLNVGGNINRVIKGSGDEVGGTQLQKVKTMVDKGFDPNGTLSDYIPLSLLGENNDYKESEPDIFSFQFGGRSGKFVLDENGVPRVITNDNIKISYVKSPYGPENTNVFTKWTIIDEKGTTYVFNEFEVSYNNENNIIWFPSSWYLTSIVNTNGDKVTFEYTAKNPTSKPRVQVGIVDQWGTSNAQNTIYLNYSLEIYLTKIKGSLWEIDFLSEELNPDFVATKSSYFRKLNSIHVKNISTVSPTLHKQFDFVYKDVNSYKLTLESVGENGLPPHIFEYYSLINRSSNGVTRQVDAWGYYNGAINPSLVPTGHSGVDLEPRTNLTKTGALTKITYPTGGTSSFEYEQNEYSYVRTSSTNKTKTLIETHEFIFKNVEGSIGHNPDVAFTLTSTTRVDIKLSADGNSPPNCQNFNNYPAEENGFITLNLPAGSYSGDALFKLPNFNPCNQVWGGACVEPEPCFFAPPAGFYVRLTVRVFKALPNTVPNYGGIRVSKLIETPNDNTAPPSETQFFYNDFNNVNKSSGVIVQEPFYDLTIVPFTYNSLPQRIVRSNPFNPMSQNSLYYKDVLEVNGLGKIYNSFTSHFDKDDSLGKWAVVIDNEMGTGIRTFTYQSFLEIGSVQSYDFLRVLPKSIKITDTNGTTKKEIEYTYTGYSDELFKVASFHHELITTYSRLVSSSTIVNNQLYYGKAYYIVGGWPRKTREVVKEYSTNNSSKIVTETNYHYDNAVHRQITKQRVQSSNGDVTETSYKYPIDYQNVVSKAFYLTKMISSNMVNYPIETIEVTEKPNTTRVTQNAILTTFKLFNGNSNKDTLVLPYKLFQFKDPSGSFEPYTGQSEEIATNSYRQIIHHSLYNPYGKLSFTTDINGVSTGYYWGYKSQYLIGEIKNVSQNDFLTSTSSSDLNSLSTINSVDPSLMIAKVNTLRNSFPSTFIISGTYKVLVGLDKQTDSNGKSTTYEYDNLSRLIRVRNFQNKVLREYCYNYSGLPVQCNLGTYSGVILPTISKQLSTDLPGNSEFSDDFSDDFH